MILQLDVGNSRVKWRILNQGSVFARGASALDVFRSSIQQALQSEPSVGLVQLSSVTSSEKNQFLLSELALVIGHVPVFVARSLARLGPVEFAYQIPETQGVDRCLVMVAAYDEYDHENFSGVMVIDAGSAITVDVLSSDGLQCEGYICSGYQMMLDALLGDTSNIRSGFDVSSKVGGQLSTRQCVVGGVDMAFEACVQGFIGLARSQNLQVYITGGDAVRIQGFCGQDVEIDSDLLFRGLSLAALYDAEGRS